jgi:endogenous inhibitor of DNA gyrase (YacG/DUF329 family)
MADRETPPQPIRLIACPQCGKRGRYDLKNPYRPFCSDRCKTHDTAQWATEGYRIPVKPSDEDEDFQGIPAEVED